MTNQRAAELQVVLEGVSLPAQKAELVSYARRQDESAANDLASLPDREYRSLDEVGEALAPAQPPGDDAQPPLPHEESDLPPGGDAYTDGNPDTGTVRHGAPSNNPPQKALEEQSKTLKEQQQRQEEKLD